MVVPFLFVMIGLMWKFGHLSGFDALFMICLGLCACLKGAGTRVKVR